MSTLARSATELVGVLHGILHCLQAYGNELGPMYAAKLEPMLADLQDALFVQCDRAEAELSLNRMSSLMHAINGAATKGEHDIFPGDSDLMDHYWDLQSIFADSVYAKQTLVYDPHQDRHKA